MDSRKTVLMNLFAGKQWKCRHGEKTYGHVGGRGGEWEEWREKHANIHITIRKIANGNLLSDSRNSTQGSVTT